MAEPALSPYPMSRHGWLSVDYDQRIWIPCPPVFPDGFDRAAWAQLYAEEWWSRSGREHGADEVTLLARTLADIHEYGYAHLAMHRGFIHLPSFQVPPLLVSFGIWSAAADPAGQLRALVSADSPDAMEPPLVEEFTTERLETGLKSLAHTRKGGTITGYVNYAWWSQEHATALRMFTGCPDLGRLERALPDMDQLARGVTIISRDR